ncbi:MAG: hypothetical protein ACLRFE_01230 [Clostridia bacterium]
MLKRYSKLIFIGILVIAGGFTAVFGKNIAVQCGVSFLCWGVAILILTWTTYIRNQQEMYDFDEDANKILQDIAINGTNSEYYHIYNIDIIDKMRKKISKRNNKQIVSCCIVGIVFLILAITFFV